MDRELAILNLLAKLYKEAEKNVILIAKLKKELDSYA